MSRIEKTFANLKGKRAALITYIMAGDPSLEISQELLNSLPAAGADIIELGMPFSDPMADGIIIQDAANRALKAGMNTIKILEIVNHFRAQNTTTPIVLMGYYNPILHYGIENFCNDANTAGVDGLIIVDLPPEEDAELTAAALAKNISIIRLISPTTPEARLEKVLKNTSGFVYFISMAGITGTKTVDPAAVAPHVENIRRYSNLPVAVGFGIKTPEHVQAIAGVADAVVVGSAIVAKVANYKNKNEIVEFVKLLSKALS